LTRIFAEIYGQLQPPEAHDQARQVAGIPSIFASSFGEMETTLKLLDQMDEEPRLSPIRFQASVHNTASGLISLEKGNRAFTTALAAGEATFAMALLEAQTWLSCHGGQILVLVAEEELPIRLDPELRFPPLGIGLLLSATRSTTALAKLSFLGESPVSALGTGSDQAERLKEFAAAPPVWGFALIDAIEENHRGTVAVGPNSSTQLEEP
jgi:hypothetical protein